MFRRHHRSRSSQTLHSKSSKRFQHNDRAKPDQNSAHHTDRCDAKKRRLKSPPRKKPRHIHTDSSGCNHQKNCRAQQRHRASHPVSAHRYRDPLPRAFISCHSFGASIVYFGSECAFTEASQSLIGAPRSAQFSFLHLIAAIRDCARALYKEYFLMRNKIVSVLSAFGIAIFIIAFNVSAASPAPDGTKIVTITDPILNMKAYSLTIPSNWIFQGAVIQGTPCVPAPFAVWRMSSPDGLTGF